MHCEDFESRLNDLLDRRVSLASEPELAAHAAGCPSCEALLRDYDGLLAAVATLRPPLPARDLVGGVVADWRATAVRRSRRHLVTALAMAATLLIAALPALRWWNNQDRHAQPAPTATVATAPQPEDQPPPLVDQARKTYGPLMAETSESLSTALAALPIVEPAAGRPAPGEWGGEADRSITSELAPVAKSATRSLVALLRVFPGSADSATERELHQ